MSRTSRMLLVLAIFAIVGVVVLGMMARRYGSILERRGDDRQQMDRRVVTLPVPAADEAQRLVDAFIEARDRRGAAGEVTDETLDAAGIDRTTYLRVDMFFRNWITDEDSVDEPFRSAFRLRREQLQAIDP